MQVCSVKFLKMFRLIFKFSQIQCFILLIKVPRINLIYSNNDCRKQLKERPWSDCSPLLIEFKRALPRSGKIEKQRLDPRQWARWTFYGPIEFTRRLMPAGPVDTAPGTIQDLRSRESMRAYRLRKSSIPPAVPRYKRLDHDTLVSRLFD